MSCDGVQALNPLCQTGDFLRSQSENAVNGAFTSMSDQLSQAAMSATTWLWAEMDKATTLDLSSPDLVRELGATSAIAGVLCLGLFLLQLTTAALRREPGAPGRAVKGLIISLVGSAGAIACTRVLLGTVDALSDGVVRYTMGTNIQGLGQKMSFTQLASVQNPAAAVLLAVIVLCAVVVVWVAMMVRKMTLLIAAVLAPLAFAGATADITRSWCASDRVRRCHGRLQAPAGGGLWDRRFGPQRGRNGRFLDDPGSHPARRRIPHPRARWLCTVDGDPHVSLRRRQPQRCARHRCPGFLRGQGPSSRRPRG
jgi:hypothetical protein